MNGSGSALALSGPPRQGLFQDTPSRHRPPDTGPRHLRRSFTGTPTGTAAVALVTFGPPNTPTQRQRSATTHANGPSDTASEANTDWPVMQRDLGTGPPVRNQHDDLNHSTTTSRTPSVRARTGLGSIDVALSGTAATSLLSKFARSPSRRRTRPTSDSIPVDAAALSAAVSAGASAKPTGTPTPKTTTTTTTISSVPSPAIAVPRQRPFTSPSAERAAARKESTAALATMTSVDNIAGLYYEGPRHASVASKKSVDRDTDRDTDTEADRDKDGHSSGSANVPVPVPVPMSVSGPLPMLVHSSVQSASTLYQHIHDMSNKRIATLNYMRRVHQGHTCWFNTVHFSQADISRLPSYSPNRLARRATNYMLLGMSIPAVLDVYPPPHPQNRPAANANLAGEYLRSLHSLLTEFEAFQQLHPADGSSTSSLARARIPHMFKRSVSGRPRKSSTTPVADIGAPLPQTAGLPATLADGPSQAASFESSSTYSNPSFASSATTLVPPAPLVASAPSAGHATFPPPPPADAPNSLLLPNEGPYSHLLTPPLPFTPDFFAVFSTLCDVLIDAYKRLQQLLCSPAICTPALSDSFSKVDARLRKVMVAGIVREFEQASREAARREVVGLQRVVLGGLMG